MLSDFGVTTLPSLVTKMKFAPPVSRKIQKKNREKEKQGEKVKWDRRLKGKWTVRIEMC